MTSATNKLIEALKKEDLVLLRTAIAEGADLNAPLMEGAPPLVILAESIVSGYPGCLPLFQELLLSGASINQADDRGYTALHWFASDNDVQMVQDLLDRGADPHLTDREGRTPLTQTSPGLSRGLLEKATGRLFVPYARVTMKM